MTSNESHSGNDAPRPSPEPAAPDAMRPGRNVVIPVAVLVVIGAVAIWQWRGVDKQSGLGTPAVDLKIAPEQPAQAPPPPQTPRPAPAPLREVPPGADIRPPHMDPLHPVTQPEYPEMAKRLQEAGTVIMLLTINESGNVVDADVDTSSGFATLDEAALKEAKRWKLVPGTVNGAPAAMKYKFKVVFKITDAN